MLVNDQQFASPVAVRTRRRMRLLGLGVAAAIAVLPMAAWQPRAEEPGASAGSAAQAAKRAQRLDQLFARLASTSDAAEGDTIVDEIWRVWLQSGRPEIDAMMQNALALMHAGDPLAAMTQLDAIVERAPDWPEGWNKRATLLYLLNEHDRSLADIDRVLALEPRHFGALAGRGLIHIARENYRAALDDYRRARLANPFLKGAAEMIPMLERKAGERTL